LSKSETEILQKGNVAYPIAFEAYDVENLIKERILNHGKHDKQKTVT